MRMVVLKRGGEPGEVAINPEMVTHVRSMAGPFTDIYFGEHRVAVQGTFAEVVLALTGEVRGAPERAEKAWLR